MMRSLDGIRVIDAASLAAGPLVATYLGELGAEVIKIEQPGTGDAIRSWGAQKNGHGLMWKSVGRNKRTATLELRKPAGQQVLCKLTAVADVVIVNTRPSTLERWGLSYTAPRGHALIDRALYLPRSWAEDRQRCADAGIPTNHRSFATKPTLATALITRAVLAKVPATWVAGDEVYGAAPRLRAAIRRHGMGYVLAVSANRRVPTHAGPIRVDRLPAQLPKGAWQKHHAQE
jgi:hypothetical protein